MYVHNLHPEHHNDSIIEQIKSSQIIVSDYAIGARKLLKLLCVISDYAELKSVSRLSKNMSSCRLDLTTAP